MRILPTLLASALLLVLGANSVEAQKKKLYRWTDEKGEVHYTDQLPPEAAKSARDQLNNEGRPVDRVERAMTPEEREAYVLEQSRLTEEQRVKDEKAKMDSVLTTSYPTEADLARSFKERFDLLERSVDSTQVGIKNQTKSLADLLAHAAGLEREGKPVPDGVAHSIGKTRQQIADQNAFLGKRGTERKVLQREYDAVLARYRELAAANADDSPSISH